MGEIRLFRSHADQVAALDVKPFDSEQKLQDFLEVRLREMVGIEFIDSETESGTWRGRRIDTIGIDKDGCPVVIEYKNDSAGGAIKQGLDYIHLLLHHADETFDLLRRTVGHGREIYLKDAWLLCIAGSFTFRDMVAAEYCSIRVELLQYCRFEEGTVALNWVLSPRRTWEEERGETETAPRSLHKPRQRLLQSPTVTLKREKPTPPRIVMLPDLSSVSGWKQASSKLQELFKELDSAAHDLTDDVRREPRKRWIAYKGANKKNYNIMAVIFRPSDESLHIHAAVNPADVNLEPGFTEFDEKMTMEHFYRCPLRITVRDHNTLECAKPLLSQAYENYRSGEHLRWNFIQPDFSLTSGWRRASPELLNLFRGLFKYVELLVPDAMVIAGKERIAFMGNFFIVAVYVRSRSNMLQVYASVDPANVKLEPGFTRDTQGDPLNHNRLEITIRNQSDLERAKSLIRQAWEHDLSGEKFSWVN